RFVGQTAEVARHLRECDVFCLPSRWEGFGYVLLEAMLLALPCVAFDIFAAREVVVTGETGVLVPDGNEAALGAVLADLLEDPERRRRLGQAGRERALAIFPIRRAVERLERLLSR
ncbi:MAG: glycosyltransferase, partial [bacterium]